MKCRKRRDDVKTAGVSLLRDKLRRNLFTGGAASGMRGGLSLPEAVKRNVGTWDSDANGEATSGRTTRARVRKRRLRGGTARSSDEVPDKGMERRGCVNGAEFNEPTSNGRSR